MPVLPTPALHETREETGMSQLYQIQGSQWQRRNPSAQILLSITITFASSSPETKRFLGHFRILILTQRVLASTTSNDNSPQSLFPFLSSASWLLSLHLSILQQNESVSGARAVLAVKSAVKPPLPHPNCCSPLAPEIAVTQVCAYVPRSHPPSLGWTYP